jgi:ATP-dependent RNA helicase RhlE
MSEFKDFKLDPSIQEVINKKGYLTPTPIQEKSIPLLLNRDDLLGIAQTGTGKTDAFSIPIVHNLKQNRLKVRPARMRVLILTPTRELASQIEASIKVFGVKTNVIFGGVGPRNQILKMSKGVDVVVATPGRLIDLMEQGHILFDQLEVLVLDEADRMLDMGFIHDIKKILKRLPSKRQTLLFSATMPSNVSKLASSLLRNPKRVEVTPQSSTIDKIDQKVYLVDNSNKPLLLKSVLKNKTIKKALVFSRTKHGANRIAKHLEQSSISSAAIHGNKSQTQRERALLNFKTGKVRVLVATDIAARGIDVSDIDHIINYNLPSDPSSYVHRIGRTARAGKSGVAISFCDNVEVKLLKTIEKNINSKIPVDTTHPFHGVMPHKSKRKNQFRK